MDDPKDQARQKLRDAIANVYRVDITSLLRELDTQVGTAARLSTISIPNYDGLVKNLDLPPLTISETVVNAMAAVKANMHLIELSNAQAIAALSAKLTVKAGQAKATIGEVKAVATGTVGQTPTPSPVVDVGVFTEELSLPKIELVSSVTATIINRILRDPAELNKLSPEQFEEVVRDRLEAMGYEVTKAGKTYQADGGVDLIFRTTKGLPCFGAVQVKHHHRPELKTGVEVIQRMLGVLSQHQHIFHMGMIVTNTSYTAPGACATEKLGMSLFLRDGKDVNRWIRGDFNSEEEQREAPASIQLTPDLIVPLTKKKWES